MKSILSLIAGAIFGAGLILGGMTNPQNVKNFLDFFGTFDPALAFVMGGAVCTHFLTLYLFQKEKPWFALSFDDVRKEIDSKLVIGSALFGLGWGISGYCPGPAIVSLATVLGPSFGTEVLLFVSCMIAGMFLASIFLRSRSGMLESADETK